MKKYKNLNIKKYKNVKLIKTSENCIAEKLESREILGSLTVNTENGSAFFKGSGYYIAYEGLIGIGFKKEDNIESVTFFEVNENIWVFEIMQEVR